MTDVRVAALETRIPKEWRPLYLGYSRRLDQLPKQDHVTVLEMFLDTIKQAERTR